MELHMNQKTLQRLSIPIQNLFENFWMMLTKQIFLKLSERLVNDFIFLYFPVRTGLGISIILILQRG